MNIFSKFCATLMLCLSPFALAKEGKFELFQFDRADGEKQPYVLYTPEKLNEKQARPLIVYLHGAASSPKLQMDPLSVAKRSPMVKLADEGGYYVLFPYGQKGLSWFENAGVEMVLAEMQAIKSKVKINEDKVFLSGFSDGGSGAFYFASTKPEHFAGFIPLNGALPVATNLGESPVYLENFNHKPFYVVNTQSDMLYPARLMQPLRDKMLQYHPTAIFKTPEGNHDMSYFASLMPEIKQFIEQHQRQVPMAFSFESADNFANQYAWLTITKVADQPAKSWHRPYQLKMLNDKASLGVGFDREHRGVGMKVTNVKKGSIAEQVGIKAGDIITKLGETVLDNRYAVFNYLGSKKAGDPAEITVERDGKEITFKGNFPPAYSYEVFTKQPLSGKVKVMLDKDLLSIDTSRVAELAIDIDKLPRNNVKGAVKLKLNGKLQDIPNQGVVKIKI